MSDKIELKACPFCGIAARLESNRDWHRIIVDHDEQCAFLDPEVVMVPATDDQLKLAVADWNRRVALAQQPAPALPDDQTLDARLEAAGMLTVAQLMRGQPIDAFVKHAGVKDLATFSEWLDMKCKEFLSLKARRILEKLPEDELHEWVFAHAAVFHEVRVNFDAATASPAAPVAVQEPVQIHHEPHNRAMWHENCPGRRFSSPMKPRSDGSWECVVCGAVGRVTAPPAAEQPDMLELLRSAWRLIPGSEDMCESQQAEHAAWHVAVSALLSEQPTAADQPDQSGDSSDMVWCACGDGYQAASYDAGFIHGSGMCQNCDAAIPARDIQPDTVAVPRELLEELRDLTLLWDSGMAGVLRGQVDALLAGGEA